MHQRPQTAILVRQKQVNPVTLEFGDDPNKRVLPGCLEKQGALVLNTPVLTGSLTTVVPSSPAFDISLAQREKERGADDSRSVDLCGQGQSNTQTHSLGP